MKGQLVLALLFLILVPFGISCAEETESAERVYTLITLRNDLILPEANNENINMQSFLGYWQWKWLGAGVDVDIDSLGKNNFFRVKPYTTASCGNWYGLLGFSTDSFGHNYVSTGFWYITKWNKINVVADIRNYFSFGKQSNYLDTFFQLTYPLNDKWYIGSGIQYDHYWSSNEDWFLVGPVIGYNFTKNIGTFLRISHEWDLLEKTRLETNRIRMGITVSF